jgi:hypothetical protein
LEKRGRGDFWSECCRDFAKTLRYATLNEL